MRRRTPASSARWHESGGRRDEGDLVWIGNWGDDERTAELHEFLLDPVERWASGPGSTACATRTHARAALAAAGIEYAGWLPNYCAPEVFARFKVTVHVPRRPYVRSAAGHPDDPRLRGAGLRHPAGLRAVGRRRGPVHAGQGFPGRPDGTEMRRHLHALLNDPELRQELARHGLETIRARHTCRHRVDELLQICAGLGCGGSASAVTKQTQCCLGVRRAGPRRPEEAGSWVTPRLQGHPGAILLGRDQTITV